MLDIPLIASGNFCIPLAIARTPLPYCEPFFEASASPSSVCLMLAILVVNVDESGNDDKAPGSTERDAVSDSTALVDFLIPASEFFRASND